jgi:hypothetical protein
LNIGTFLLCVPTPRDGIARCRCVKLVSVFLQPHLRVCALGSSEGQALTLRRRNA